MAYLRIGSNKTITDHIIKTGDLFRYTKGRTITSSHNNTRRQKCVVFNDPRKRTVVEKFVYQHKTFKILIV